MVEFPSLEVFEKHGAEGPVTYNDSLHQIFFLENEEFWILKIFLTGEKKKLRIL